MSPAGFPGLGASTNWPQIYGIAVHIPLPERDPPGPPWADLLFASTRDTATGASRCDCATAPPAGPSPLSYLSERPPGRCFFTSCPRVLLPRRRACTARAADPFVCRGVGSVDECRRRDGRDTDVSHPKVERHDPIRGTAGTEQFRGGRRLREPAYRAARASPSSSTSTGRLCK